MYVRSLADSLSFLNKRYFHVFDSRVFACVAAQGRSSSKVLNRISRRTKRAHIKYEGITDRTLLRYRKQVSNFFNYLHVRGLQLPDSMAHLDSAAAEYVNHLYMEGEPHGHVQEFVSGLRRLLPSCRKHVDTAKLYCSYWGRGLKRRRALPIPADALVGMVGVAFACSEDRVAVIFLVGFLGLLRTGKLVTLTPKQVKVIADKAQLWRSRYVQLAACLGDGELAERLAAAAPAQWELMVSENGSGITKRRRNVALHAKVIPTPLVSASPVAPRRDQHGPCLGHKEIGGRDDGTQISEVEFKGEQQELESYVNPISQAEYHASNFGESAGIGGGTVPTRGAAVEGSVKPDMQCEGEEWPVLVICPSSLRFVWKEQAGRWLPDLCGDGRVQVIKSGKESFREDAAVWVISYNLLAAASGAKYMSRPCGNPHQLVICDESHNIKEWSAKRTKAAVQILQKADHAILLSGTPTRNTPDELHAQLAGLQLPGLFSYASFRRRYCIEKNVRLGTGQVFKKITGARNANELNLMLTSSVMIRQSPTAFTQTAQLRATWRALTAWPVNQATRWLDYPWAYSSGHVYMLVRSAQLITMIQNVLSNGLALERASERMQDDDAIAWATVQQDGQGLAVASARLQDDEAVAHAAAKLCGPPLGHANGRLRGSGEWSRAGWPSSTPVGGSGLLVHARWPPWDDGAVARAARRGLAVAHASWRLCGDEAAARAAVEEKWWALKPASK
ncbi:unnamed protein product [Prorocentrum cordatum]|uniref:Helicase ATP-binding domain-containing protein n=1 Tax=Prorocentrum cordatum TaxID=2364126 RepID=A0ABN9Y897_9DINO|nr:unnamed protein product [Polarella glacialis]